MRLIVRVKHVAWRDGRPRFSPGPKLRALGFKGEDLKDARGQWLTAEAVRAWMEAKEKEIAARRSAPSPLAGEGGRAKRGRMRGRAALSVEDLFEDLWKLKRLRDAGQHGSLSENTVRDYRVKAAALMRFDPELWTSPAAALDRSIVLSIHERLWDEKGLAMANGVVAVLRLAFSSAIERRPDAKLANPCLNLRLPASQKRVRVASPEEIVALMAAADATDPEVGDAILLALHTGQRQGDVLRLEPRAEDEGKIRFVQGKTGARVRVKATRALRDRLAAAKARRMATASDAQTFVVDSRTKRPFQEDVFRHRFAKVRSIAARQEPGLEDFLYMDLRDTALTRLANSGSTIPEIAAVSGHSMATVAKVLEHYVELNEAQSDAAMAKLEAWMEAKGVKL